MADTTLSLNPTNLMHVKHTFGSDLITWPISQNQSLLRASHAFSTRPNNDI